MPIGRPLHARAWRVRREGHRWYVAGELILASTGAVLARGEAVMVLRDPGHFGSTRNGSPSRTWPRGPSRDNASPGAAGATRGASPRAASAWAAERGPCKSNLIIILYGRATTRPAEARRAAGTWSNGAACGRRPRWTRHVIGADPRLARRTGCCGLASFTCADTARARNGRRCPPRAGPSGPLARMRSRRKPVSRPARTAISLNAEPGGRPAQRPGRSTVPGRAPVSSPPAWTTVPPTAV